MLKRFVKMENARCVLVGPGVWFSRDGYDGGRYGAHDRATETMPRRTSGGEYSRRSSCAYPRLRLAWRGQAWPRHGDGVSIAMFESSIGL